MKKHIRKLVIIAIAVITLISVGGCGIKPATIPEENKVKVSEIENTKSGIGAICKALKDKEYVSDDCVQTNAALIGANEGYRFDSVKFNSSVFSLEIYEFSDTSSDTAKKCIDEVKKNNSFTLFGKTVEYCYMSDNGKYLLIYPDPKTKSDKADDKAHVERLDEIKKIINSQK